MKTCTSGWKIALFCALSFTILLGCTSESSGWRPLLSNDLSDFELLNGSATFRIEKGVLIGTTQTNTPNTFLATKKKFGDFILEFEVLVDDDINSGVQIRSESKSSYYNGRVHGYQVEIDPSPRRWSGGIYDEGRRNWLYPLSLNPDGQSGFQHNEWNHYRIEALGRHIKTWVNGIPAAHLVDDMTPAGFIAFQVHSIGSEADAGKEIRWRNIRIIDEQVEEFLIDAKVAPEVSYLNQQLTDAEIQAGWKLLWDGKTFAGWSVTDQKSGGENPWSIQNGILKLQPTELEGQIHLVSAESHQDFELSVDFLLSKNGQSGIQYGVDENSNVTSTGLEYQLMHDPSFLDTMLLYEGVRSLGALYDIYPAQNLSEEYYDRIRYKGIGRWNRARIVCEAGVVQHWLNGILIVSASLKEDPISNRITPDANNGGRIVLQNQGSEVWFRNIKIREL